MELLFILKGVLVPIAAILAPVLIVVAALNFTQRRQEHLHRTVVSLIERGLPVPPELLDPPRRAGMSPLMRAMTLVGSGLGLSAFLYTLLGTGPYMPWAAGAIPVAIGIAQLVALRIEADRASPAAAAAAPADVLHDAPIGTGSDGR